MKIKRKVIISDPCYKRDTWCMTEQDNMIEGTYIYYVDKFDETPHGNRIKSIEIVHEDYKRPTKWKFKNSLIGVDSGQAGIFCDSIYPLGEVVKYSDKNTFYRKCCELTSQNQADVDIWYELLRDTERLDDSYDKVIRSYEYYKRYVESLVSFEKYLEYDRLQLEKQCLFNDQTIKNWEEYEIRLKEDYNEVIASKWYHKRFEIYKNYLDSGIMPKQPYLIKYGIIDDAGIVSSSGFGDGQYNCYANFNKVGKCIGVKIKFM